jgi:hypothetical protein
MESMLCTVPSIPLVPDYSRFWAKKAVKTEKNDDLVEKIGQIPIFSIISTPSLLPVSRKRSF